MNQTEQINHLRYSLNLTPIIFVFGLGSKEIFSEALKERGVTSLYFE